MINRSSDTWKAVVQHLEAKIAELRAELESEAFSHNGPLDDVRRGLIREFLELTHLGERDER